MLTFEFFNRNYFIYIIKCLLGLSVCYFFHWQFPGYRFYWSMISVLLVISPDDLECKRLPIARIKANIIGSLVGLIFYILYTPNLMIMCLATITTIIICSMIQLGGATRSALAALIIVLVQQSTDQSWISAGERMFSVVLGCTVALIISMCFAFTKAPSSK